MSVKAIPWKRPVIGPDGKRVKGQFIDVPGKYQVYIHFRWPDGTPFTERKVIDAKTQAEAKRWGEYRERTLRSEKPEERAVKAIPTFADFAQKEWLPVYPVKAQNAEKTVKEKKGHLKHLLPYFGAKTLAEVNEPKALDRFVAHMSKKTVGKPKDLHTSRNGHLDAPRPISAKRIKNVMTTLHTILDTAVTWGVLPKLCKFPKIKTPEPVNAYYTTFEVQRLLDGARDADDRLAIMFACYTGARAGELLALEWGDLDLVEGLVTFARSRTDGVTRRTTKSNKPRTVPLHHALVMALKKHRHLKGDLVFCQVDGAHLTLWHLHGALDRAARKAAVRRLRWHDLRHSYASNLVIGGTPLPQVQAWLGHSSITMTMRYARLAPEGGRKHLASLDAPHVDGGAEAAAQ